MSWRSDPIRPFARVGVRGVKRRFYPLFTSRTALAAATAGRGKEGYVRAPDFARCSVPCQGRTLVASLTCRRAYGDSTASGGFGGLP
jgi:hypothetical protein